MEIWHLGHSCFKIKGKTATLITDPFDPEALGLKLPSLEGDVVTISHNNKNHANKNAVKGNPVVFDGPGEYEVKGIKIYGLRIARGTEAENDESDNTIFQIIVDGINILHLGNINKKFLNGKEEEIKTPDILLIPIGGKNTINVEKSIEIITMLEPKIVIPMHYQEAGVKEEIAKDLGSLSEFLKKIGKEGLEPQPKIRVTKDSLPQEMQTVVLS